MQLFCQYIFSVIISSFTGCCFRAHKLSQEYAILIARDADSNAGSIDLTVNFRQIDDARSIVADAHDTISAPDGTSVVSCVRRVITI